MFFLVVSVLYKLAFLAWIMFDDDGGGLEIFEQQLPVCEEGLWSNTSLDHIVTVAQWRDHIGLPG